MKKIVLLTLLILRADFFDIPVYSYYIEFKAPPSSEDILLVKKSYPIINIEKFYNRKGEYWAKYYETSSHKNNLDALLKNNSLIARVEKPVTATPLSLEPSQDGVAASDDTFIRYQWALDNHGQTFYRSTDDIHPVIAVSKPGFDVQWKALQNILEKKPDLRRPVVAVIDSGLSYTHDEITHALYKNDIECKNGLRIDDTDEDKDGNGFAGDCLGWNFTTNSKRQRNNVLDDIGHGTHITGIMAAKKDDVGISGLWDQIQILPLKVYSQSQAKGSDPIVQSIAKAVLYAIDRKVDVINLSLGWPTVSDIPVIRNALQAAIDANITIVAGAGNDSHSAKVLPCSYDGVICVGATALDGTLPDFTNYGGQVDIMAPGEAILSLFPPLLISRQFGIRKYNIANGTSQSTPYVSATVAVLKSYYPGITNNEIMSRLKISANTNGLDWGNKFAASGLLQAADAVTTNSQPYVAPIFKNINLFLVNLLKKEVSITLPIKNYWKASGSIQVVIESDDFILSKTKFNLSPLANNETKTIQLSAKLPNIDSDYLAKFKVTIIEGGKAKSFTHQGFLASDIDQVKFKDLSVESTQPIQSVNDYEAEGFNAEFFYTEKTDSGMNIQILRVNPDRVYKAANIDLPSVVGLYPYIGVTRVDLNYDNDLDYFITAVTEEDGVNSIIHYALDKNLKPLFGKHSTWIFKDEGLLIQQTSMAFASYISPELGKIRVPAFLGERVVPSLDQNPDPFEPYTLKGRGLYVLQPIVQGDSVSLTTRLLNNYKRLDAISKRFSLRFNEDSSLLYYDINNENIRAIFASGLGVNLKYYNVEYSATDFSILSSNEIELQNIDLRYQVSKKISDSIVAFFGIFRNNFANLTLIDLTTGKVKSYEIESDSVKNGVISLYAVNIKGDRIEAFIETVDSLYLFTFLENGSLTKTATPILRFSYLPGKFFTDILFPIHLNENDTAIYVDSTLISGGNVHTWVSNTTLTAPIKYSMQVPKNCVALNPRKLHAKDHFISYLFLCKNEETLSLRQVPLN